MNWFKRIKGGITTTTQQKKETPEGLWAKCPKCNAFDIIKSPASVWKGNNNHISAGFSTIPG